MVKEIKKFSSNTKQAIEDVFEVIYLACVVAAACKVATLPRVNGLPVWEVVAGVLFAVVAYKLYSLMHDK